jgi:hypothetical protein
MQRISARIDIVATALEPIHHGAGTSGNTQLLRTQDIVLPDGRHVRVPFISGNSIKHMIRDAGSRFAIEAMGIQDGSLTKGVTDLLFSGGALTKIGSSLNLASGRKLEDMFPLLGLCGYSAGNTMTQSKIRVNNLHLVCEENAWRAPGSLQGHEAMKLRAGDLRSEEFGTRHESSRRPYVAKMLVGGEKDRLNALAESPEKGDSAQMIYDYEIIKPGSVFWGSLYFDDITEMEQAAFKSALSTACEGRGPDGGFLFRVGAKSSIGCGLVSMILTGQIKEPVRAPGYTETKDLVCLDTQADLVAYTKHLHDNSEEIAKTLTAVMA